MLRPGPKKKPRRARFFTINLFRRQRYYTLFFVVFSTNPRFSQLSK
jgi:hypothetical protein